MSIAALTTTEPTEHCPSTLPVLSSGMPKPRDPIETRDPIESCVHCGFCLEVCPTYRLTGDENNSPRGRLKIWREEANGRLKPDPWTDFYTSECVGCLACESACPSNVPYGDILERIRHQHVQQHRGRPGLLLRLADILARRPAWFNTTMLPARVLRSAGWLRHRKLFPGQPASFLSTRRYAQRLSRQSNPTGPRVALFTGCLMESLFREINFATVRVLIDNNIRVVVPPEQGCCGAFQEHCGLGGVERLRDRNQKAFGDLGVEAVLTNSAGCGLAVGKSLEGGPPVYDVIDFLDRLGAKPRKMQQNNARLYLDLPCHRVHGQKNRNIPSRALDATGLTWELAPMAQDCCGSGGVYHLQKPANAEAILTQKSAFLNDAKGDPLVLVTMNHVCMMQWNSARFSGMVQRPFQVKHLIQLLDPKCNLQFPESLSQ